ncbi:MAG: hypothetical protein ACLU3I_20430 [Acutalibacteraceae bacterium]
MNLRSISRKPAPIISGRWARRDARGKSVVSAPACATITVTLTQEDIDNQKKVKAVEDLIDAIGEVTENSGDAIAAAREAYDALPDDLKGSVTNYDKLKKAEDDYKGNSQ